MTNNIKEVTPVYSISSAAELLGISVHTLRMYEREKLLIPFKKETNHRRYSKMDIEKIECIREAINREKISIAGIKRIYSLIPCWNVVNCSKEEKANCKAFNGHSKPCWSFEHKGNRCEGVDCRNCPVYVEYSTCSGIKELIKKLSLTL